jgi:hypothetical protein
MAIQLNGQEVGPVKFTDDKPGKTLHVGLVNPTNPVDGDLWIDSDALNNAGKNLIQTIDANTGTDSITFAVSPEYKDLHVVLRGLSNTLGGTVLIRTNGATTGYLNAGGVATNAFFTVPFLKASVSVNQLQFTIYDAQHSASSMWGRLEGFYADSVSNLTSYVEIMGGQAPGVAVSSINISTIAGNFNGGTILVYGVN